MRSRVYLLCISLLSCAWSKQIVGGLQYRSNAGDAYSDHESGTTDSGDWIDAKQSNAINGADEAIRPARSPSDHLAGGGDVPTISTRVNEVYLLFTAVNKRGRFVCNLKQSDFTILDDHKPPLVIRSFRQETDLPLHLGLLVDMSGSVDSEFEFEQNATISFLGHTLRRGQDEAFILSFNSHSHIVQDSTDNVRLLSAAVYRLRAGGGTALYDAIYQASKSKFLKDQSDQLVRRAIIVISDGEDNQSEVSLAEAIEMAQRAQVIIYAISTNDTGLIVRGDRILQQIAEATGGRIFFPFQLMNIAFSFREIEGELRSQYAVSYTPAAFEADGHYRSIEISTTHKNVRIRSRRGYFAPGH